MSILRRFKDIMSSNINALLDRAEDPEKMVDQYLRNMNSDLGKVKSETAAVMAEEQRATRAFNECQSNATKMQDYAIKALESGNEDDARIFLEKKAVLETKETDLEQALELATTNAKHMRQMHDKLVKDIGELEEKRTLIKSKAAVVKTQERMNEMNSSVSGANHSMSAFDRMEDKVNKALDEANAMSELNQSGEESNMRDLTDKYDSESNVDDELARLKAQIAGKTKEE